jgi:hypothetical protein
VEGTCGDDFTLFESIPPDDPPDRTTTVVELQPADPPAAPSGSVPKPDVSESVPAGLQQLALLMPWGQQITLPDHGTLILGRSLPSFRANPTARERLDISREHARLYRDADGELMIIDLTSANGTYLDGVEVADTAAVPLRPGQRLRLGQEVLCEVVRLNEYGEPEDA